MNGTRSAGAAAGYRWLVRAVDIGRRNPGAIFGGAAWLLVACVAGLVAFVLLSLAVQFGLHPGPGLSFALGLVITLPMLLVMALGMTGYLRLIDAVESGRDVRASAALDGFRAPRDGLRLFGAMLAIMLVQQLLMAALVAVFAPEVGRWYLDAMQGGVVRQPAPTSLPAGFWTVYGLMLVFGLFIYGVQSIAYSQVVLRGASIPSALADGVVGTLRNVAPMLVMVLLVIVAAIVLAIGFVLLVLLLGLLGKLVGGWLAFVLLVPLYLLAMPAIVAFSFALMYHLWRDIAGGPAGAGAAVEA
jgi:hypothetical protein